MEMDERRPKNPVNELVKCNAPVDEILDSYERYVIRGQFQNCPKTNFGGIIQMFDSHDIMSTEQLVRLKLLVRKQCAQADVIAQNSELDRRTRFGALIATGRFEEFVQRVQARIDETPLSLPKGW